MNILRAHFSYASLFGSFSLVTVSRKKLHKALLYEKCACKMFMKLTPGVFSIKVFFYNFALFRQMSLLDCLQFCSIQNIDTIHTNEQSVKKQYYPFPI